MTDLSFQTKTVNKEFRFKDLKSETDYAEGYFTDGDKLVPSPSVTTTGALKSGLRCLKVYDIGFTLYFCSDGKLYRKVNGEFKDYKIPATSAPPSVFSLIYDGEKTAAVVCATGTYLLNDRISFIAAVKGNAYAEYNGTLFIAKGKKIIVCGDADYTGDFINFEPRTFLYPEGRYGAVLKFVEISRELYAVCQRGAVKITLTGDDMGYALKDCDLPPFKCVKESVFSMGNEAYFINLDGLNKFDGKRVLKIPSFFDKKIIEVCGDATAKDNYYLLPVNLNGERKIYCYDVLSGKETFLKGDGILVAGGKTASFITNGTGEIDFSPSRRVWRSVKTDFGTRELKTLSALCLENSSDVAVTVEGDGIVRTFTFKAGEKRVPITLRAEKFCFTLTDGIGDPTDEIAKLIAEYRL